ncbi:MULTISPECIES: hypothetical protein [Burkholderia]|uniref:Uncharacterized protein n=2 Tax=Burkholderia cepacia complex TaxID=87882 RepID=A0ABU2ED37_9BURK|nr:MULTISPECIES: hypothetical protein [Burkholderia]MDN7669354.1 hypothetical protein [Burkholderia vietnamiensis]MDR8731196.1 hypothetical protein [Burkholderia pseudomultivorans]MDR8738715.1 hypothetical protein [Burkholderia pseudomultivorans]MDR8745372.1 hypothetical protein [Burkholderia pseudomultivorans]MDR8757489.1 hypothetical protein [Burkholderia pseudomultivorans]
MANSYYDATGVLVLDRVTPVISALFDGFLLDATWPGNGQAFIARISDENDPQWHDIRDGLMSLAAQLDLPCPEAEDVTINTILRLLAGYFHVADDDGLNALIDAHSFEAAADLETLFVIAIYLDDGHGLRAIQFEGCWHCSKPRLFEFGGDGTFISREVIHYGNSRQPIEFGTRLRETLIADDLDSASAMFATMVRQTLSGITDKGARDALAVRLATLLHETRGKA